MNILITSAGKRVELLQEFQRELTDGKVLSVDLNPQMAPACHVSDEAFPVPRATAPDYIPTLLDICKRNDVRVVIPTIDTELELLAVSREVFKNEGIDIMVSDTDFISLCRDKRLTMRLFDKLGIPYPAAVDRHNPTFPLFAKPYDGSLSSNLHIIRNEKDLTDEILNDPKLIFMELIDKTEFNEFTVDMYYGNDGFVKCIVPRERLEIRSGEINKGITRKNKLVGYLKERMNYMPGVRGCICIQLFYSEDQDKVYGIEINPRFGGGYPLSYYAGANFPRMMIEEYILGKELSYMEDWKDGTIMLRYDSQVIINDK